MGILIKLFLYLSVCNLVHFSFLSPKLVIGSYCYEVKTLASRGTPPRKCGVS